MAVTTIEPRNSNFISNFSITAYAVSIGDFDSSGNCSLAGGSSFANTEYTYGPDSSWYPVAIVGYNVNGSGLSGIQIYRLRLTGQTYGQVGINFGVRNRFSGAFNNGTIGVYILWVKGL